MSNFVFNKLEHFLSLEKLRLFSKIYGAVAVAGAEIFDKLDPEPHKNGPAPQHR
jgi:hypothetical protein